MFNRSSSAFDEALSKPFLEQATPEKTELKKWTSWTSALSSNDVQEMEKDDDDDHSLFLSDDEEMMDFEYEPPKGLEEAILEERTGHLEDITSEMKQIHEISSDLANLVETQDEEIKGMTALMIETEETTEEAVSQLEKAYSWVNDHPVLRRYGFGLIMLVFMVVVWANELGSKKRGDDNDEDGTIDVDKKGKFP
jgi:hypothetical protein